MKTLIFLAAAAASGCAAMPNSVSPEFEHISHATQHFGPDRTNYGANIANVTAEWDVGKHFYVTLAEGLDLDKTYSIYGKPEHGEIMGPREEFTGRVGYKFITK
jgi:hypothetical protein